MRLVHLATAIAILAAAATLNAQRRATPMEARSQQERADRFFGEARYEDAYRQYVRVLEARYPDLIVPAVKGMVRSALRLSSFQAALREATTLKRISNDEEAFTLYGDALWGGGLFDEAEAAYRVAYEKFPASPRARFGVARLLTTRGRTTEALAETLAASTASPNDPEILVLLAQIYERLFQYDLAARVYEDYVKLLPERVRGTSETATLKIKLLRSFAGRTPVALEGGNRTHTIPFRMKERKVVIDAVLNGKTLELVLDTGAEQTAVTRDTAERAGIRAIVETLITGVGKASLKKLAVGRVDTIKIGELTIRDAPVSIRRENLPGSKPWHNETFSPAAFGLSVLVDYRRGEVTLGRNLPVEAADISLPLRVYRLPLVRGMVNEKYPAYFIVDTGGEMLSITRETATQLAMQPSRHIGIKVWGVTGLDPDAYVLPGVDLAFQNIHYKNFGVAVLNLRAPSVLLGFQLGGILGYNFLSEYRVTMDVARGELRLQKS
jgi:predicted aspartyl protease